MCSHILEMKVISPQSLYCIVIVKTKEKVLTFVWLFYFFKYVDISTITAAYCSAKWHFRVTGGKIHVMTTFQKLLVLAPFMMLMLCVTSMYKKVNKKFQCHHIFDLLLLTYDWISSGKNIPKHFKSNKSIYLCDTNKIDFFRKKNFHLFLSDGPVRIKQEEMGNVLDFLGSLTMLMTSTSFHNFLYISHYCNWSFDGRGFLIQYDGWEGSNV